MVHQNKQQHARRNTALQRLIQLFSAKDKLRIAILIFFSVLAALFQTFGVASIFPFINVLMDTKSIHSNNILNYIYNMGHFQDEMRFVKFLGVAAILVIVMSSALTALASWLKLNFVQFFNYRFSSRLLASYLNRPYPYFLQKNSSEISKNVLAEVTHVGNTYLYSVFDLIINVFMIIFVIIMLMVVNIVATTVIMLSFGLLYGLISWFVKKNLKASGERLLEVNKERYSSTNEALAGIKITKVSHLEGFFVKRFDLAAKEFARINLFARVVADLPNYVLEAITFGGMIGIIMILIARGVNVDSLIPTVTLYAFAGYRIIPELGKIFRAVTAIHHNQPIIDRLHHDLFEETIISSTAQFTQSDTVSRTASSSTLSFNDRIDLRNIIFRYENAEGETISDLSLQIPKNTIIGFAGTTGSGKTTLIDIILGLLVAESGQLIVDGQKIIDENINLWQQKIAYVPQDVFLIDDSIRRNIAFGYQESEIDDNRVRMSAQVAAIFDFITSELPEQFETVVGERGVRLSGGQRQRLGLARAIYRNPEILILDEATSALDGATEEKVLKGIYETAQIKTILMIAHRLNTLKACDRIFFLEKGKIIDQGTYDDLVERNRKFRAMAKI